MRTRATPSGKPKSQSDTVKPPDVVGEKAESKPDLIELANIHHYIKSTFGDLVLKMDDAQGNGANLDVAFENGYEQRLTEFDKTLKRIFAGIEYLRSPGTSQNFIEAAKRIKAIALEDLGPQLLLLLDAWLKTIYEISKDTLTNEIDEDEQDLP